MPDTEFEDTDLDFIDDSNEEEEPEADQATDNPDGEDEPTDDDATTDDEESDEDPEGDAPEIEEGDAVVTLPDGTEMTVTEIKELEAGGLRLADYTTKTTEVADQRKAADEADARNVKQHQFLESTLQNFLGFIDKMLPPEPSVDLAYNNPAKYQQDLALRNAALAEIGQINQIKAGVDQNQTELTQANLARYKTDEDAKLVKAMPHLADPVKRAAFDKANQSVASEFGFTEQEIADTADSRVLRLVHYAKIGMKSETNQKNAKRRIGAESPKKGKAKAQRAIKTNDNKAGMQRLAKSGSIEDAMTIYFD